MMNYKIQNKEISLILCVLGGWFGLHHTGGFYRKCNDQPGTSDGKQLYRT